jgi:hypothetical protein
MSSRTLRLVDEAALQLLASKTRGVASYVGSPMTGHAPTSAHLASSPQPSAPKPDARATAKAQPPRVTEDDLQISCFQLIDLLRPQHPILEWVIHVPNGGKRHRGTAGRLKAMGVKKGVSDVLLPLPYNGWAGWAIELKVGKNRTTDEQDDWLEALAAAGYYTAVCYTLEQFKLHLESFLHTRSTLLADDAAARLVQFLVKRRAAASNGR